MDSALFLAHIAEDGRMQTVAEHLISTANLAKGFARPFGAEAQAELAGLAHDIGKYSAAFQQRLQGSSIQVDHATAGAAKCWQRRQPFAAFAVAGHHGGLPDLGDGASDAGSRTAAVPQTHRTSQLYGGGSSGRSGGYWSPTNAGSGRSLCRSLKHRVS